MCLAFLIGLNATGSPPGSTAIGHAHGRSHRGVADIVADDKQPSSDDENLGRLAGWVNDFKQTYAAVNQMPSERRLDRLSLWLQYKEPLKQLDDAELEQLHALAVVSWYEDLSDDEPDIGRILWRLAGRSADELSERRERCSK